MAANITLTGVDVANGPYALGGKLRERVKAVGTATAANDTGSYNCTHLGRNVKSLSGAFSVTAETVNKGKGATVTIEANFALGSDTAYLELEGDGI